MCEHCGGTAVAFSELPDELRAPLKKWAKEYGTLHEIAHWSDEKKKATSDYQSRVEVAAKRAEQMLHSSATNFLPRLLEFYPTIIWEDQDECLDVRPEDIGAN
jgi:hypothetical protein